MSYIDIYNARQNPGIAPRVAVALLYTARGILQEPSSTTSHAIRMQWARQVFTDPDNMTGKMIWAFLSVPSVASNTATDAQLQNISDTIVDLYPGL